eukprot:g13953.t1
MCINYGLLRVRI